MEKEILASLGELVQDSKHSMKERVKIGEAFYQ